NSVPITLTALPTPGYRFVRWEGAVNSTESEISVTRNSIISIHAVFEYDEALVPHVFFTELQYNPINSSAGVSWVELYNADDSPLDISGWILCGQHSHVSYVFPLGTVIPAKTYLVVCSDTLNFKTAYSNPEILYLGNISF